MEENPLANGRDGFLSLVQGCKLRLEAVFSERHVGTTEALGAGYHASKVNNGFYLTLRCSENSAQEQSGAEVCVAQETDPVQ